MTSINWQGKTLPRPFPDNSLRGYRATQIIIDDPHAPEPDDFPEIERWKAFLAAPHRFPPNLFEEWNEYKRSLDPAAFRRLYVNEWVDDGDEDTRL